MYLNAQTQDTTADLMVFRTSRSSGPMGEAMREHLGMNVSHSLNLRGNAPAFSMEKGKMTVRDWESGNLLPDFRGIAYDYMSRAFVLLGWDEGERSINYLLSPSLTQAEAEAKVLIERLGMKL
ncbi:hypothetical protein [Cupriavidus sp. TMH.W2]|uniref:hypothetical protein n=1 Tax=Cupriavidus sp. TMH.W2 TaxID=3434465 RepID=UPI003D76BE41